MGNTQTFIFRIFTGERHSWNDKFLKPIYHYETITHSDENFRRQLAQNCVEYIFPKNSNIIRVDHLSDDALLKLLEYDQKKFGGLRNHNHN